MDWSVKQMENLINREIVGKIETWFLEHEELDRNTYENIVEKTENKGA